jgi:hypothetical protein
LIQNKGENYWIFKPPNLNRGNGIRIIKNYDGLKKCIDEYKIKKLENLIPK